MDSLLELFGNVDDFCKRVLPIWECQQLVSGQKQQRRARSLAISEPFINPITEISKPTISIIC